MCPRARQEQHIRRNSLYRDNAGEYFHGNLPVVSQIMLTVFKVHARWVAWATEHHINHFAFTQDAETEVSSHNSCCFVSRPHIPLSTTRNPQDWRDLRKEEQAQHDEHESRANMPMFLLRKYAFSDLLAMLFGSYDKSKPPSFLVTEEPHDDALWREVASKNEKGPATSEDKPKFPLWQKVRGRADADEDTSLGLGWNRAAWEAEERAKLPFRRKEVQLQISEDIAADKRMMKQMLANHRTKSREEVHDVMARRSTLARRQTSAILAMKRGEEAIATELDESEEEATKTPYQMAKDLALNRSTMRRMTRQATHRPAQGMPGSGPDSVAAIAKLNFDQEQNQDTGGEVAMAIPPAQTVVDAKDVSYATAD